MMKNDNNTNGSENMSKGYSIRHQTEGSICLGDETKRSINGTYQEAVDMAHQIWKALTAKRSVYVYSEGLHWWHCISATGEVSDRNMNSGVSHPESYSVKYTQAGYVAI